MPGVVIVVAGMTRMPIRRTVLLKRWDLQKDRYKSKPLHPLQIADLVLVASQELCEESCRQLARQSTREKKKVVVVVTEIVVVAAVVVYVVGQ